MLAPMLKLVYHSMSFIGIYFTIKLLYEYFNKSDKKDKNWFHKVLFFPDQGICNIKDSSQQNKKDSSLIQDDESFFKNIEMPTNVRSYLVKSTSLIYLLKFIKSAKKSLELCLLIFTLNELQDAIIEAKRRGVTVRVIIDKTMSDCDGSCLPAIQKENIPVLRGPSSMMVHHKFALADSADDDDRIVATGSINWTWGAVTSNFENMIITNNPDIVIPFKNEFERLWSLFSN